MAAAAGSVVYVTCASGQPLLVAGVLTWRHLGAIALGGWCWREGCAALRVLLVVVVSFRRRCRKCCLAGVWRSLPGLPVALLLVLCAGWFVCVSVQWCVCVTFRAPAWC